MIQNGNATYVYDAENRLIATGGFSYIFDGDGVRIEKCTEGATPGTCSTSPTGTFYWRKVDGSPQAETDLSGNWTEVYGAIRGQLYLRLDISGSNYTPHYYYHDYLHSTNIITDQSGNLQQETDYYPYGGEISILNGDSNRYRFTGKEHDAESGLDYFGARHYASSMGRFMTPDWDIDSTTVPYASFGNPQSLNLYSYVGNNPATLTDPDGHCWGGDTICGFPDPGYILSDQAKGKPPADPCPPPFSACVTATPLPPAAGASPPDNRSAFQRWIDAWDARIDANRAPPQKPNNLDSLQNLNNIMMGLVPIGGIRFGNNPNQDYHTFRHVEDAGISKDAAAEAIQKDLAGKAESLPQGLNKGTVNVGGKTLDYNAYKLPDGTINVGRITVR